MQMTNSTCRNLGNLTKSVLKGKISSFKMFLLLEMREIIINELNIQLIKLEEQSMNRKRINVIKKVKYK